MKKIALLLLVQSFSLFATEFQVLKDGDWFKLTLPDSAESELKKQFPSLRLWKKEDYHPVELSAFRENPEPNTAPFALVHDFNHDQIQDAILWGTDGKEEVVLSVLSAGTRFQVKKEASFPIPVQRKISTWNGVKSRGLTGILRLNYGAGDVPTERRINGFNMGLPQTEEDNHGNFYRYIYENGKFTSKEMLF